MQFIKSNEVTTLTGLVADTQLSVINLAGVESLSIVIVPTNATPAAITFGTAAVDATGNTISFGTANADLTTGIVGQFTIGTADTLPAPLATGTNYFLINETLGVYKVATSYANAIAGTSVNLTDVGVGSFDFVATTGTATAQLKFSNDQTNWISVGTAATSIGTVAIAFEQLQPVYAYATVVFDVVAGQYNLDVQPCLKTNLE